MHTFFLNARRLTEGTRAFASSTPLKQYREQGRWPESFDRIWESLKQRHGKGDGTREMIELLLLGRKHGFEQLKEAVEKALSIGCTDGEAVRYLIEADRLWHKQAEPLVVAALQHYDRPQPSVEGYDQLLMAGSGQEVAG